MATRLDKIMAPILEEKRKEAFAAGYNKGVADGWKNKRKAYENEIASLKRELEYREKTQRFFAKENGDLVPLDVPDTNVGKWIPVSERLPEDLGEYIVMIEGAILPSTLWFNPWEEIWYEYYDQELYKVSHWMPLPEPPKEEE